RRVLRGRPAGGHPRARGRCRDSVPASRGPSRTSIGVTRRWWPGRQRAGSQRRLLGVCVALAVGCIDTSSPNGPVLSISAVRIASPSIAVGDVMRDSAGNPAPVSVTAFDGAGHPVTTLTPTFVVPTRGMHLGTDLLLVGDSIGTSSVV